MSLETAVTISDLDPNNPSSADPKSQGDDHLRAIKDVLRKDFAGHTGAISVTGTDGGLVNAYTITPLTALPTYGTRMLAIFSPTINNTGACTLNISGLGPKSLKTVFGTSLTLGDLIVGQVYIAIYTGTEFRLIALTKNYIDQLTFAAAGFPAISSATAGFSLINDGSSVGWSPRDLRGEPTFDKGSSGTTNQVVNFADGAGQTLTATGTFSLSATGFPVGRISAVVLRLVNGGAFAFSTTGIEWIKADGSKTTSFSAAGVTLQTAGADYIMLLSYGDGTPPVAKVAR